MPMTTTKKKNNEAISSELSPKTLVALIKASHITEDEIQHWHGDFLHHCPSGQLNKSQFVEYAEKFHLTNHSNDDSTRFFDLIDVNKDGLIDFNEFLAIVVLTSRVTDLDGRLSFIFEMWDESGDGFLDRKELINIIRERSGGDRSAKKWAKDIIKKFDRDGDEKLNKDEFIQGCKIDPIIRHFLLPNL